MAYKFENKFTFEISRTDGCQATSKPGAGKKTLAFALVNHCKARSFISK